MAGIWPPWPFPGPVPAICRLPWSIKADPTTPQANPSPHLPSPRAASPSPSLSCSPERGRRRAAVDPAATNHRSPHRLVQEDRHRRLRLSRVSIRAGPPCTLAIDLVSTAYILAVRGRLPPLLSVPRPLRARHLPRGWYFFHAARLLPRFALTCDFFVSAHKFYPGVKILCVLHD